MTDQLPDPLVPSEVDLRDFQYMELDVRVLRDSRFAAQVTGDAFRAGVLLWCASWHQVPAGSLPDDDIELASLAGYGRFIKEWRKVKEEALSLFMKCSDGRLYHRIVAGKALSAWDSRLRHHYDRARDRLRKTNKARANEHLSSIPELTFEQWNERRLSSGFPPEKADASAGIPEIAAGANGGIPPENALKGKGRVNGEGEGDLVNPLSVEPTSTAGRLPGGNPENPPPSRPVGLAVLIRAWEKDRGKVSKVTGTDPRAIAWANAGVTDEQLREAYSLAVEERMAKGDGSAINAGFLDVFVAKLLNPPESASAVTAIAKAWHDSNAAVLARGKELGLIWVEYQDKGHSWSAFKADVLNACGETERAT